MAKKKTKPTKKIVALDVMILSATMRFNGIENKEFHGEKTQLDRWIVKFFGIQHVQFTHLRVIRTFITIYYMNSIKINTMSIKNQVTMEQKKKRSKTHFRLAFESIHIQTFMITLDLT